MRLQQFLIATSFTFFISTIVAQKQYNENEPSENLSLGIYYQNGPGSNNALNWKYQYGTKLTVNGGIARNFEITSIYKDNSGYAVRQYNQINSSWTNWRNFILDDGSGNLGIGTTSPDEKLHVEGNLLVDSYSLGNNAGIFFREGFNFSTNNYNLSILNYDHSNNGSSPDGLSINAYDGVSFSTGASVRNERMRINKDGNVGIGTTDPKNKLSVNGTIWAKKVTIQLTDAADWVFEDDYYLRPLSEVANFIKTHKHLPEIPSAEEFRANDMEVSQMTNKLLQKIEELTLYTIAQEEKLAKMKVLEQQLEAQNIKLAELEALKLRMTKIEALLIK